MITMIIGLLSFCLLHKRQIVANFCATAIKILVTHTHKLVEQSCRCVCVFVYDIYISYFVRIHVNCIKNNHKLPQQIPQWERPVHELGKCVLERVG